MEMPIAREYVDVLRMPEDEKGDMVGDVGGRRGFYG